VLPKGFRHDDIYRLHPLFQLLLREGGGSSWRHNLEDFFLAGGLEVAAHRSLKSLGVRNRGFFPAILGQIQRDIQNNPAPPAVISGLQGCVASDKNGSRALSHIGNVRSAISTTRCNLLRLAPPAAWTAIP
jgi:hypothetical protein